MNPLGCNVHYAAIIYSRTKYEDFKNHLTVAPTESAYDECLVNLIRSALNNLSHKHPIKKVIVYASSYTIYGNFCYIEMLCPTKLESKYSYIDTRKTTAFIGACFKNPSELFPVSDEKLLSIFEKNIGIVWDLPRGDCMFDKTIITEYEEFEYDVHPDPRLQEWCRDAVKTIESLTKTERPYMLCNESKNQIKNEKQPRSFWSRLFTSSNEDKLDLIENRVIESHMEFTEISLNSSKKCQVSEETLSPEELYNLGRCYEKGKCGFPINFEIAVKNYTQSAKNGYTDAQYRLGCLYADGKGASKDLKEAEKWMLKAAEQGHKKAKEKVREFSVSENSKMS